MPRAFGQGVRARAPLAWQSLRWRLPASISLLVAAVLAVFLWASHREVEATLVRSGGARAESAAAQLASLLELRAQQRLDELRRLADDPDVVRLLESPSGQAREAAISRLSALQGPAPRRLSIWDEAGSPVLDVALPSGKGSQPPLPVASDPPEHTGFGPFQQSGQLVYVDTVVDIPSSGSARRLGRLLSRSTIRVNPPGVLQQLVGRDAAIALGNSGGDVWSNLAESVPGPPIDAGSPGIREYRTAEGRGRLGAVAHIRSTPWAVWVEFPRTRIIAPAREFLNRMLLIALLVVFAAAVMVRLITGRSTTPLAEVTAAAESISAGDYGRRVEIERPDEVGRLGAAFNTMAAQIQDRDERLEARIRERTEALDALRVREAHYRAMIELAFDCVITIDAEGRITEFNPAAERTFGYRREDVLGQELASLVIPPNLREAHRVGVARFASTGERRLGTLFETTAMRANGAEFPIELAVGAIPSHGHAMLTGVIRDITQRKQVERALLESERAYRSTFDEAPVGIAHTTLDGQWLRLNRRLVDLVGFTREELLATQPDALAHPDEVEQAAGIRESLLAGTVGRHVAARRYRHKNGDFVWINRTISLHRDAAGGPLYFIEIIEDLSERRHLEEQLRQSQKMEAVGRLAGGVAHDFNNLLTAILGYSSFVLDDLDPSHPARRDVEEIQKAGESAASLTRQLLAFSRRQVLQPQIVDLNSVVRKMDALLRRLIGEDVSLTSHLATPLDPVNVDPGQVEQIIMNLAVNARDAMSRGGLLTITTANVRLDEAYVAAHPGASARAHVMLAISDTGAGMSLEVMSHLFEPFYTTKPRGEGTGLGLATVYGIVSQSGGSIDVSSEPGRGTTFRIYFPVATRESERPADNSARVSPVGGGETIVVAEDQAEVRGLARKVLRRHGYTVLEARSGEEALRIIREHRDPIHLLLTDVVMPAMSGQELVRELQRTHPEIRVLYASGYTDDAMARHGLVEASTAFIPKPFTPKSLLEKVRDVLDAPPSTRKISRERC